MKDKLEVVEARIRENGEWSNISYRKIRIEKPGTLILLEDKEGKLLSFNFVPDEDVGKNETL